MNWTIEKRKRSTLIFVTDRESTDILIGSGSNKNEYERSMELEKVIVKALNENEQTGAEQEGWVCKHCGKSTFETDYDYLADVDEHLGCALEKER